MSWITVLRKRSHSGSTSVFRRGRGSLTVTLHFPDHVNLLWLAHSQNMHNIRELRGNSGTAASVNNRCMPGNKSMECLQDLSRQTWSFCNIVRSTRSAFSHQQSLASFYVSALHCAASKTHCTHVRQMVPPHENVPTPFANWTVNDWNACIFFLDKKKWETWENPKLLLF